MKTILSSKGQVVIPAAIRKDLGLKAGMHLTISRHGRSLLLSSDEPALKRWSKKRTRRGPLPEPLALVRPNTMPPPPSL